MSWLSLWTNEQINNLICYLHWSFWEPPFPTQRMVLCPQLALWLNNQTEIISVTWVCRTPAWDFDRWECLLHHLQTRAQGNSHQTSHLGWHTHTKLTIRRGPSVSWVTRTFVEKKEGEKGIDWWKFMEICEEKAWDCALAPLLFSH